MKNVSRFLLVALVMLFATLADARNINIKLKIDDPNNTQYSAYFQVFDILGNYYTITSTNPVNWLQNGVNDVVITCPVAFDVIKPFYKIKVYVRRMNSLLPVHTDEIQPVNTDDLYQQTHYLGVSF